jgi:hypothetical protein
MQVQTAQLVYFSIRMECELFSRHATTPIMRVLDKSSSAISTSNPNEVWVWERGHWHRKNPSIRKRISGALIVISLIVLVSGLALVTLSPTVEVVSSSRSCPYGGRYYSSIRTSLCGLQEDVCVSYDYNCGNDYHPPREVHHVAVYGLEGGLLFLAGLIGLIIGVLSLLKSRGLSTRQ